VAGKKWLCISYPCERGIRFGGCPEGDITARKYRPNVRKASGFEAAPQLCHPGIHWVHTAEERDITVHHPTIA